ncbi:THO complex subunit 1 [Geosmithia morbida]|uniref:THO complex subunit 1 n=1 Tax=Geosmithia morbida TaxID=1094350 RepID=A0A9P4YWW1_9HYPO|nr:THO complex subunit 1 [Geosmithia morbida]KAF4123264.1 THO complex subunit 1 [Geosmithia morbida]
MHALHVNDLGIPAAEKFASLLKELMAEAAVIKPIVPESDPSSSLEPPLNKQDFDGLSDRVANATSDMVPEGTEEDEAAKTQIKARKFALIEAVTRDIFSNLTASTPIDSPEFAVLWDFLDIIYLIADDGHCEPALLFWLIEELLESQVIPGCRTIFDYLESRRERITAKHTKSTDLVILRSCNELLRRLSRAEDTAFCGRVFIFLFQSFPLGDRSSVNLRGEYHVENVTTYEKPSEEQESSDKMDMDIDSKNSKEAPTDGKAGKADEPLSSDQLYDLFWSLQESFSQPLTLFEKNVFKKFQHGVEETVKKFRQYPSDEGSRTANAVEDPKQSLKRKREGAGARSEAFNPKYLTSKDLFELEIGDLTFRRHVLVQMLIVLNFVLSWTGEAKKKYEKINVTNKSVIYPGEFSEEDAKWALAIKGRIADYLRKDTPGKIFHRMVDTVLARDKNWVYWKMASCEPIQREPVQPSLWAESQSTMQRFTTNKRLRPVPLNAVPMDFLEEKDRTKVMDELKDPKRYQVPELDSFKVKISDDDFEISMATNDADRARAAALKASKTWRAVRIARGFKLAAFDKIDDDANDVSAIFKPLVDVDDTAANDDAEQVADDDKMPTNRETVVLAASATAAAADKVSSLISHLQESHRGVFARVVRHTTRDPAEGETSGRTYHFVKKPEFNQLRDGDRLVEYTEDADGVSYGTSSKAVDAVTEAGKVAIIEMSIEAAKFAQDMDFTARYILIQPSDTADSTGYSPPEGFNHVVNLGDDVAEASKTVGEYIFERKSGGDGKAAEETENEVEDTIENQHVEEAGEEERAEEEKATNGEQRQQDMEVDGGAES